MACEHAWWHAAGVTRHLVCVKCGLGLHDIDLADYPHLRLKVDYITGQPGELVSCDCVWPKASK